MQLLLILRQNFYMIRSYWKYFGNTLMKQLSILAVVLADTPHALLKCDLIRQYILSIIMTMIDKCIRRGIPSLSAQVKDIETADLGREIYYSSCKIS